MSVGKFVPGQSVHGDDRTLGQKRLFGPRLDVVLDVGLTEQLERAQVEMGRARDWRSAPQPLATYERYVAFRGVVVLPWRIRR